MNAESVEPFPSALPRQLTTRLFFHLGVLISLLSFGSPFGGLIEIPVSFLLKNKRHALATCSVRIFTVSADLFFVFC